MAFRTILIEKARRINLDLNSIVVNYDDKDFNINLDEISVIVFDDPMCLISLKLLSKMCEKGITIVLTDYSHNPVGTMVSYQRHARAPKKLKSQLSWNENEINFLWKNIIKGKINNQIKTLLKLSKKDKIELLEKYITEMKENDSSNREGLAARTYFKELFSDTFKRFDKDIINYCLNYIYQVIRAKISQEIVSLGYITQLGINHKSEYNYFNLSDDLIEPYRPIVDYYVYEILKNNEEDYLTPQLKRNLLNILNEEIYLDKQKMKIVISIQFYIQNLMSFMENGIVDKITIPSLI